jgi:hypothetical protein
MWVLIILVLLLFILGVIAVLYIIFSGIISGVRSPKYDPAKELAALEEQYMADASKSAKIWAKHFKGKTDEEIAVMIRENLEAIERYFPTFDSEPRAKILASQRLKNTAQYNSLERKLNMALEIARAEREASATPRDIDEERPETVG